MEIRCTDTCDNLFALITLNVMYSRISPTEYDNKTM